MPRAKGSTRLAPPWGHGRLLQLSHRPTVALSIVAMLVLPAIVLGQEAAAGSPVPAANGGPSVARSCLVPPCPVWERSLDGPGSADESGRAIAADASRTFVVGSRAGNVSTDIRILAYTTATGGAAWNAAYDGPVAGDDTGVAVAVASGRVFALGQSRGEASDDVVLLAYDAATGAHLWTARYDNPYGGTDAPGGLAVSPDGARVFVGLRATREWYYSSDTVLAYSAATGVLVWAATGPEDFSNALTHVAVSGDGLRVFSTDVEFGDARVRAWSASDGEELWSSGSRYGVPRGLATTADGLTVLLASDVSGVGWDVGTSALAANNGTERWYRQYDGPAPDTNPNTEDEARSIAINPNGTRVYVAARSFATGTYWDYATLAYDLATGADAWVARYNGPGNSVDDPLGIKVSPDGLRVAVTGGSNGGWDGDYATVVYGAWDGQQQWVARLDGAPSGWDLGQSVAFSPDSSRVLVTGDVRWLTGDQVGTFDDATTISYVAASGAQSWLARHNEAGSGEETLSQMAVSLDGSRVYGAATTSGTTTNANVLTIARDAATGATLWTATYDGPVSGGDHAEGLAVSPDGSRVFVAATSAGTGSGSDAVVLAYAAASGALLWTYRVNGPANGDDVASAVALSPDGSRLFLGGSLRNTNIGYLEFFVAALNPATGAQTWLARRDISSSTDSVRALAVSPDGARVILAGQFNANYGTMAFTASTGAWLWTARYAGPLNNDYLHGLLVSPDSTRVYVTGASQRDYSSNVFDVATVAYDAATGTALWESLYGPTPSRYDEGWGLGMNAAGSELYVGTLIEDASRRASPGFVTYAPSNGTLLRAATTSGRDLLSAAVALDPDGSRIVLAGYDYAAGGVITVTALSLSTGSEQWTKTFPGNYRVWDSSPAIAFDAGGDLFLAANGFPGRTRLDAFMARLVPGDLPGAPTGLVASPGPGMGEISLSWYPPADDGGVTITSYRVFRGPVGGPHVQVGTSVSTAFTDSGLLDAATYEYSVAAVNALGDGSRSSPAVATTFGAPSSAPGGVTATAGPGAGQIRVTWTAPAGPEPVTSYRILRAAPAGEFAQHATTGGADRSYTDSGLGNGASFRYAVVPENRAGQGPTSAESSATTFELPSAPTGLVAQPVTPAGRIRLTWTAPSTTGGTALTGYAIYRGDASGAETFLATTGTSTTFTDTGLPRAPRYYQIRAVNLVGEGPASNEASATAYAPPSEPRSLVAQPGSGVGAIRLNWQPPADNGGLPVTAYRIYRGTSSGSETLIAQVGTVLTFQDSPARLESGGVRVPDLTRNFYYRVAGINAAAIGPQGNEACSAPSPYTSTVGPPGAEPCAPAGAAGSTGFEIDLRRSLDGLLA